MTLTHGLDIVRDFVDTLTGEQQRRADEAIARIMAADDPRWAAYVAGKAPLEHHDVLCGDCREIWVRDWPVGLVAVCDGCLEERRASWL